MDHLASCGGGGWTVEPPGGRGRCCFQMLIALFLGGIVVTSWYFARFSVLFRFFGGKSIKVLLLCFCLCRTSSEFFLFWGEGSPNTDTHTHDTTPLRDVRWCAMRFTFSLFFFSFSFSFLSGIGTESESWCCPTKEKQTNKCVALNGQISAIRELLLANYSAQLINNWCVCKFQQWCTRSHTPTLAHTHANTAQRRLKQLAAKNRQQRRKWFQLTRKQRNTVQMTSHKFHFRLGSASCAHFQCVSPVWLYVFSLHNCGADG